MYVNVSMKVEIAESVVIPDSAVMNTGLRQIVFVDIGGGQFEPREVKTGYRSSGLVQVISGVAMGEKVVVRANFLLDSESRLRAAILESAKASDKGGGGAE
jgi:Cu(I)/Ag(I) efflux system membrane fusion protein